MPSDFPATSTSSTEEFGATVQGTHHVSRVIADDTMSGKNGSGVGPPLNSEASTSKPLENSGAAAAANDVLQEMLPVCRIGSNRYMHIVDSSVADSLKRPPPCMSGPVPLLPAAGHLEHEIQEASCLDTAVSDHGPASGLLSKEASAVSADDVAGEHDGDLAPDDGQCDAVPDEQSFREGGSTSKGVESLQSPAEDLDDGIMLIHSSRSTTPSLTQRAQAYSHEAHGNWMMPLSTATSTPSAISQQLPRDIHVHGVNELPPSVGFLGKGPFWTCGSAPHSRHARATGRTSSGACASVGGLGHTEPVPEAAVAMSNNTATVAPSATTVLNGLLRHPFTSASVQSDGEQMEAVVPVSNQTGRIELHRHIQTFVGNCIDFLSGMVVDVAADVDPPEEELTSVILETKEQRLQWRDFLSEAVSKSCANTLYAAFDVEAHPPRYARPQVSSLRSSRPWSVSQHGGRAHQERDISPHIVAPSGAGWTPVPLLRHNSDANASIASEASADATSGPVRTHLDEVPEGPRLPIQTQLLSHHQDSADSDILPPTSSQDMHGPTSLEHSLLGFSSTAPAAAHTIPQTEGSSQRHPWLRESEASNEANELRPPPAG